MNETTLPQEALDFDRFLNEPPEFEDRRSVREFRPYCLGSGTSQVLENGKHVDARCSCTYAASGVLESRDDQQEKRDGAR